MWLYQKKKEEHISQQKKKSNNKKHKKTHIFSHPLPHTPKDTQKTLDLLLLHPAVIHKDDGTKRKHHKGHLL